MATNTPKNSLGEFYTNLTKTANNGLNSLMKSTNSVVNSAMNAVQNTPQTINSLLPLSNNSKKNNSLFGLLGNNNTTKTPNISVNTKNSNSADAWGYAWPILIFITIAILSIVIIVRYKDQIVAGINNINQKIRDTFNKPTTPLVDASEPPPTNVTEEPIPPQDELSMEADKRKKTSDIFDKVVPIGTPEVFNVSKNTFTYYDAEPMCRALGAELATYDQVKEAWSKGADWCNYGWVKGQAAVYPIQEETYNKIQSGPDEEKNSCGTVGLNGGYFENPELKFGVNCYGVKPPQSENDQELLMKQGKIPRSVAALKIDQKVQEFKRKADSVGVLPFNNDKWSKL
jgi:hypothetical protein